MRDKRNFKIFFYSKEDQKSKIEKGNYLRKANKQKDQHDRFKLNVHNFCRCKISYHEFSDVKPAEICFLSFFRTEFQAKTESFLIKVTHADILLFSKSMFSTLG
jgi:hypothetical protein